MKSILAIMLVFLSANILCPQGKELYSKLAAETNQATKNGDFKKALARIRKINQLFPSKPDIVYEMAQLYAVNRKYAAAEKNLLRALQLGHFVGGSLDRAFAPLKTSPGFARIENEMERQQVPVHSSRPAFIVPQQGLIPEGMCFDPVEECFYLGSIARMKIIKIDKDGSCSDFTAERQDGLRIVLGIKVDPRRRVLWALSHVGKRSRFGVDPSELGWAGVFKYDLTSGKLLKKFTVQRPGRFPLFNDIAVAANGDIYFTDSEHGVLHTIPLDAESIQTCIQSETFFEANGISFGKDDRTLFLACSGNGVFRIDLKSRKFSLLKHPLTLTLVGIDGIYYYQGSLVCVQNGLNRISRFYLDSNESRVIGMEIIEIHNDQFEIPTTGAIAGGSFYYIANSQLAKIRRDGTLADPQELNEAIILVAPLAGKGAGGLRCSRGRGEMCFHFWLLP